MKFAINNLYWRYLANHLSEFFRQWACWWIISIMNESTFLFFLNINKKTVTAAISTKAPTTEPTAIGKLWSLVSSCFLSCWRRVALLLVVVFEPENKKISHRLCNRKCRRKISTLLDNALPAVVIPTLRIVY